jgi:hypothetical protein
MTVAWIVNQPDSYKIFESYKEAVVHREKCAGGEIQPLVALTDSERQAIMEASIELNAVYGMELNTSYVLRELLARSSKDNNQ